MQWTDLTRRLAKLSATSTLVLAACGGGDKNLGPENGGNVDTWQMVAVGNTGLPAAERHWETLLALLERLR